jgi:hypothetical protein
MSIALWVSTLNQTVARVLGIRVKDRHPPRTRPLQAAAVPPTSLPSYTLRLLLPVATQPPLHPLKLTRALVRDLRAKPRHPLPFALWSLDLEPWHALLRL